MKTGHCEPETAFEFWLSRVDTAVRVERYRQSVVIRTSRDRLSAERKQRFVHELVAEGFVPDAAEWGAGMPVEWVVDASWLMPSDDVLARTHRQMCRVLIGGILLWAVLMVGAFVHSASRPTGRVAPVGGGIHRLAAQR